MNAHTPGPWVALKGAEDEPDRWIVCVDGPRMFHVATVENGAPGDTLTTEGENARLIAAAPDLLAACLIVWKAVEYDSQTEHWESQLRAAIAKATGQEVPA